MNTLIEKIDTRFFKYDNLMIYKNFLYFSDKNRIYEYNLDLKEIEILIELDDHIVEFKVIDKLMYISAGIGKEGFLYRLNMIDGSLDKVINNICFINIVGNKLYYIPDIGQGIISYNMETGQSTKLYNDNVWSLYYNHGSLYYYNRDKSSIEVLKLDDGRVETLVDKVLELGDIVIKDKDLYFTNNGLDRLNTKTLAVEKILKGQVSQLYLLDRLIFFKNYRNEKDQYYFYDTVNGLCKGYM